MSIFSNILNRPLHTLAEASPTTAMDTSHVASVDLSALNSPSTITESPYPEVRNDIIQGGMGNDALYGNEGSDEIYGLGGNDVIRGYGGKDLLDGGAGNDSIYGGDGADRLRGGADNDKLWGDLGNDTVLGGAGKDSLWGGAGDDNLDGQDGDDMLWGGAGNDNLWGTNGNDTLAGGEGSDNMSGGQGKDVFDYFSTSESKVSNPDLIRFFKPGEDKIDLSDIDANTSVAGDQGFNVQSYGNGQVYAGDLIWHYDAPSNKTIIEAGVDNSNAADMRIELDGNIDLKASDFIL